MSGLSTLESLDASYCGELITDTGLQRLSVLSALQTLGLRGYPSLTDAGLQHLSALSALKNLNLANNYFITDNGLQHLLGLSALQSLDLSVEGRFSNRGSENKMEDAGLQLLIGLPELHPLSGLSALTSLNLAGYYIDGDDDEVGYESDVGLQHLSRLQSLILGSYCGSECGTDSSFTDVELQHLSGAVGAPEP